MAKAKRADLTARADREGGNVTPFGPAVVQMVRDATSGVFRAAQSLASMIGTAGPSAMSATENEALLEAGFGTKMGWQGPGRPQDPRQPPGSPGREFDFPPGYNLRYIPRSGEFAPFYVLRALCDNCDIFRRMIERRKARIARMPIKITPVALPGENERDREAKAKADPRIAELLAFMKQPDRVLTWDQWTRNVLEQMIVTDAVTIYPVKDGMGRLLRLEVWDGATISLAIDDRGRTPEPPLPAYRQIIRGIVDTWFTTDELLYWMCNPRSEKIYGNPVSEQVFTTINMAIRRSHRQLFEFTMGNTPVGFFESPPNWSSKEWNAFRLYWESMASLKRRSQMQPIPSGVKVIFPKDAALKDEFDEWIARICADALGLSATAFIKQTSRATAEVTADSADEEGDDAWSDTYASLWNRVLREVMGISDLEVSIGRRAEVDQLKQAQTHEIYVKLGVLSPDDVLDDLGRPAIGAPNMIYTANGAILMRDVIEQSAISTEQKRNPPTAPAQVPGGPQKAIGDGSEGNAGAPGESAGKTPPDGKAPAEGKAASKVAKFRPRNERYAAR